MQWLTLNKKGNCTLLFCNYNCMRSGIIVFKNLPDNMTILDNGSTR